MNINIWTAKIYVVFKIIGFVFLYMYVNRISNFLMAKEVNKEVKKKLQHQCPTIKYYENTKYALNRKVTKTNPHNWHGFFFRAIEMRRKRNIGAE
jgi:hypothetical protein